MRWILIISMVITCLVGCTTARDGSSGYLSEEQKLVGAIRLARTLDTDSTEVEDMIILIVYQLRFEDQNSRADKFDEIGSEISNCAVKESTGRLRNSHITKRIDTLLDQQRFSQLVAKSYEACRQHIAKAQILKQNSKVKEKTPQGQRNVPLRESSYYELIQRYFENQALETTVSL